MARGVDQVQGRSPAQVEGPFPAHDPVRDQGFQLQAVPPGRGADLVACFKHPGLGLVNMDQASGQALYGGGPAGMVDVGMGQNQVAGFATAGLFRVFQNPGSARSGPGIDQNRGPGPRNQVGQGVPGVA